MKTATPMQTAEFPFPPPDQPRFSFVDLYAGIGGFRLALQSLGGQCTFSSEINRSSCLTHAANFGEAPLGDINDPAVRRQLPQTSDLLCAGFPCQPFSSAGRRRGFLDERGGHFFTVADIIGSVRPKGFILENVKGLVSHDKGRTLKGILAHLRGLGYSIPEPQILNASDFGLAQNRERVFIVGFRGNRGEGFSFPKPQGRRAEFGEVKEFQCPNPKYFLSAPYLESLRRHRQRHESKGSGFGFRIIPDDGTANALMCGGMGRERNLVRDDRLTCFEPTTRIRGEINREGVRRMTPREWARLQGFPDHFIIPVSDTAAYRQFGNSVAIPVVMAVASSMLDYIH